MEQVDISGQVEQELHLAFCALREGDAPALERLTASVLSLGQDLLQSPAAAELSLQRLQQIAARVQSLRAAVLRHAAMTDQALQMLVPAAQSHTYGAGVSGASVSSPYGAIAKASGRMGSVLTA